MNIKLKKWQYAFIYGICAAFFVLVPCLAMRPKWPILFWPWQEQALIILTIVGGILSGVFGFNFDKGQKNVKRQDIVILTSCIFVFLYVSCAVLCERVHFCFFENEWLRTSGFILFVFGFLLRLQAMQQLGRLHSGFVAIQQDHQLIDNGLYAKIRHPSYLGVLITALALPLIFGAWLPLFAIPAVFIALKWRINDEERLLAEYFGDPYSEYKKKTWKLLPYVY